MRNVLFRATNFDYEEGYSILIWEQNGNYFVRTRGHSVMCGDYDTKARITSEEALEIMMEEAKNEDDSYLNLPFQAA